MGCISIAEVRRRLPLGTEAMFEYIDPNAHFALPDVICTRRRVAKQNTTVMITDYVEGPRVGRQTYCYWRSVVAEETDGVITLLMHENKEIPPVPFVKISLPKET